MNDQGQPQTSMRSSWQLPSTVAGVAAVLFGILRSRDFSSVDGALLPLRWFKCREAPVAVANHALEYKIAAGWDWVSTSLGWVVHGESEFLLRHSALNALAAAATLGVICWLAVRLTASAKIGLLAAALVGSSFAFLRHATHSAQPIPAVLLVWVALVLVLRRPSRRSVGHLVWAGALFALASAIYLPMLLALPAILASTGGGPREANGQSVWMKWTAIVAGASLALVALSPWLQSLGEVHRGSSIDSQADFRSWWTFWLSLDPMHWLQLPLGLASGIWDVLPDDFRGIRSLFASGPIAAIQVLFGLLVSMLLLLGYVSMVARSDAKGRGPGVRTAELAATWLVAGGAIGPLLVSVYYGKLWILPVSGLALLVALRSASRSPESKSWKVLAAVWLLLGLVSWRSVALEARTDPGMSQKVRALQAVVGPDALVVSGWDAISVHYAAWSLCSEEREVISLPTEIAQRGEKGIERARKSKEAAIRDGRPVFALDLLDSKGKWADSNLLERRRILPQAVEWLEIGARRVEVDGLGEVYLYQLER